MMMNVFKAVNKNKKTIHFMFCLLFPKSGFSLNFSIYDYPRNGNLNFSDPEATLLSCFILP